MDIQSVIVKAMMHVFINLIYNDYCPRLTCVDGSLTLWTEDASCEIVLFMNRERMRFGEHVFSVEVVQGEGESYLADMVVDEMSNVVKEMAK